MCAAPQPIPNADAAAATTPRKSGRPPAVPRVPVLGATCASPACIAFRAPPADTSVRCRFAVRACSATDDYDDDDLRFSGMSGGKLVHEALVECGVDTVFGYSGGANLPILDQFNDSPIRFVMNRSEQCCGHAAEGYARASGRVGVVLTTSGPGLTNIITPLQDARGDSTPILALSGQVPTAAVGTDAFQECLAVDLTRPCTKWSYQVKSVEEVRGAPERVDAATACSSPPPLPQPPPPHPHTARLGATPRRAQHTLTSSGAHTPRAAPHALATHAPCVPPARGAL